MRYKGFVAATLLLAEDVNLEERSSKDGMAWLQVLLLCKGNLAQPCQPITWSPHLGLHLLVGLDGAWLDHD